MLDDLGSLRLFERIVALGSLSAAARDTGLSLAVVSKRLAQLERGLDVRLLNRTTRRLSLTDEGALLHTHAQRVLDEVAQAESALSGHSGKVTGTLRMSAPNSFGRRWLVPALAAFAGQHPELDVQLSLSDEVVDLVGGGFDLAVRYGVLADSRLVARELAPNRRVLCASPAYLSRRGVPRSLDELPQHDCILIGHLPMAEWRFGSGSGETSVRVHGHCVCDDGEAVQALALAGAGIALKSIWDVGDDLESGRLVQVLPRQAIAAAPLHAVYPSGRYLAPRVRLFVELLARRLQAAWRWDPAPPAQAGRQARRSSSTKARAAGVGSGPQQA